MSDVLLMSAQRGHHREVFKGCFWVVLLALVMGLSQWLPMFQRVEFLINYVPLNIIFEVSAFTIAMMIFGMAWVTQRYRPSLQTLVIGIGFLGIGLFDLSHVLSYQVLPDFITANTPEKAINFWLAARLLTAVILLFVAFLPSLMEKRAGAGQRRSLLLLMLTLVALVHVWFLLFPRYVPDTYVVGQGLTDFKVHFEYLIIGAHMVAALGLANRYRTEGFITYLYLAVSAIIMAMGEHFFTIYVDFTDANNILGHLYKIITYGFLYRALFREMVYEPYQYLRDARSRLQATVDALPDSLFEVTRQGDILSVYAGGETGDLSAWQIRSHANVRSWLSEPAAAVFFDALHTAAREGVAHDIRIRAGTDAAPCYLGLSVSKKHNAGEGSFLVLSRDISQQVANETRILHETHLNSALLRINNLAHERDEQHLLLCGAEQAAALTASTGALVHQGSHDGRLLAHPTLFGLQDLPALNGTPPWQQAADSGQLVYWQGNEGGISLPVLNKDGVCLVISVFGKTGSYVEQDHDTLNMLASTLWSRLSQCRQHRSIQLLSKALEQNPYPVIITDAEVRIQYVNKAFTRVSGYAADEVMGRNPRMLRSGKTERRVYADMWAHLNQGRPWKGELLNRRRNGSLYFESASIYPICDETGRVINYVAHKEDITQHRENEERLRQLSQFDQLTGVLNKHAFEQQLAQQMTRARTRGDGLSLLWLDLDNFKSVNDTLGYVEGDELLVKISNRLRNLLAPGSLIGRPEGDSFVLAVDGNEQEPVALLAERVLQHVQEPVNLRDNPLSLSASLGIATFPHDGDNAVELFKAAELAMYRVKQDGRNGLRFYAPEMQKHSERALALATALKNAIANNELTLAFQPQLDLEHKRMIGAEALLRWRHAEWGFVSPAEFIPLAEQNGLIVSIGWWVIDRVLEQLALLHRAGRSDLSIAVNVSAVQLVQPDFVSELQARVAASGVPAGALDLELTESVAMVNPEETGEKIAGLSAAGFCISIDDFGTGYSSMSYLKRFSVDKIKIDKSFIDEVTHNHEDKTIVNAIIHMAGNLGMRTIAEGVETEEQLETLQRKGCNAIQGYWYSRPLPADDFAAFIAENH
ncbi:EAL domain-containing protein [Oceanimonas sp. CHS3-5]|uniref:bifunctional diguanylate cyclase/phosphodiesterase n=1 Tax=Oceanimonas sp. CHS3-5 TaxID=3068186 RepID=UPI00273D494D|nr:EAL domain-containing protein [Oceanimonas sp. CHS3-5]MDP5291224.1 EAL domain-containing protein [Oceanimonas sp. CHS3-5]